MVSLLALIFLGIFFLYAFVFFHLFNKSSVSYQLLYQFGCRLQFSLHCGAAQTSFVMAQAHR